MEGLAALLHQALSALSILSAPIPAHPGPTPIAAGGAFEWTYRDYPDPASVRVGDLAISVRTVAVDTPREGYVATIAAAGRPARIIRTGPMGRIGCCQLTVGRLDRSGARYVLLDAFTGGPHCCQQAQLVFPDGPARASVALPPSDVGTALQGPPTDIDGDGRTDFVMRDNDFMYAFGFYADSSPPPQIWNVRKGRLVNVSAAARYRHLFVADMAQTRPICLRGEPLWRNAACAGYVAAAARIGRFNLAWREMLGAYTHDEGRGEPAFPQRLRRFLVARGYVRG